MHRLGESASCSYVPRARRGLTRPAQPRQLGGCGLSVELFSCRIHQHPPSQGRACIRRDAIMIQSRGSALEMTSNACTVTKV